MHKKLLPLLFSVRSFLFCWLVLVWFTFLDVQNFFVKIKINWLEIVLITSLYYTTPLNWVKTHCAYSRARYTKKLRRKVAFQIQANARWKLKKQNLPIWVTLLELIFHYTPYQGKMVTGLIYLVLTIDIKWIPRFTMSTCGQHLFYSLRTHWRNSSKDLKGLEA